MKNKTVLILHRKSADEPAVKEAVNAVKRQGIKFRVLVPWNKSEKRKVVAEALANGADRIIAGGGDGTINAVANALIGKGDKPPQAVLGVLPLGTANDFARGCELPTSDLAECLRIACTRDARLMDVGKANKKFFLNVASAGFGAEITATTPVDVKKLLGGTAYTIAGFVKAFNLKPYTGELRIPGEVPVAGDMIFMAVANNHFAGGGFDVAPHAKTDDGLLDLTAIRHPKGFSVGRLSEELKDPMNPDNEMVFYRQLPEFTLKADNKLHCNLDGEPLLRKRLSFSILPRHIGVVY